MTLFFKLLWPSNRLRSLIWRLWIQALLESVFCVLQPLDSQLLYSTLVYSPEKWLHNWICHSSNRSKQIQETHTAYSADTQPTRQSLNGRQHTRLHRQLSCCLWSHVCCFSFKLCRARVLCTGAISRVSFLNLFGPIAGVTNPIM